jgi:glycosyltransferase involved in cell wall biosynthesis
MNPINEFRDDILKRIDKQSTKVSIGMPVYNMESTVQEAIDTVLNQTFSDFHLIISDNASDDGTEEICRAAARQDSRIIYHRNPVNIYGENFRLLLLLSRGKYFMLAGADDARMPEMLSRCVDALEADPEAVAAYTYTEVIDPATGTKRLYHDPYRLDQEDPAVRYVNLIHGLDLGNVIYGLYRRSVLFAIPPIARGSSRFCAFTDALFLANVVLQGKVIQIPETLFIRRRGKSKEWIDNIAYLERCSFPNFLTNGVTLPTSESIQEHVRDLMASTLPVETKLRLIQVTYEIYSKRWGNVLSFEIDRAVQLAKAGKFTETWNGMPVLHPDKTVQNLVDQFYARLLLDRLELTSRFIQNNQGLHLGKAFCLAKMGRTREAELEFTLSKELVPLKAMQK